MTRFRSSLLTVSSLLLLAGCGDDDDGGVLPRDGGTATDGGGGADAGLQDGGAEATMFTLRIENRSGDAALRGPVSPGVWATHAADGPFFTADEADRGEGLAAIAEDGDPSALATSLAAGSAVANSGAFDTPVGAAGAAPAFPGEAYEVTFPATRAAGQLSFATMLVQSNDIFLGPSAAGIDLFMSDGTPIPSRDVTDLVSFWDVGTEVNEAPGLGPNQAPRQDDPNTGAAEGVVAPFTNTTHAIPLASELVRVDVTETAGTYTVMFTNVAPDAGALLSPFSPVFYAVHDDTWSLFEEGAADRGEGLEGLAEDGDPTTLVASHSGATGVEAVGSAGAAPVMGGESISFDVTPTAAAPWLTLATMVVESNDAFIAPSPSGIRLLDDADAARPAADVQADLRRTLAVWDAGTEINEIIGAGAAQPGRQGPPNTGDADPDDAVRRYNDSTNALAGQNLGGNVEVTVTGLGGGMFEVRVRNTGSGAFPAVTPVVWAVHSVGTPIFETGAPASAELEQLAEDGDPAPLSGALGALAEVSTSGVIDTPDGAAAPGALMPGQEYVATVTASMASPYLSLASMIVPSNDTFVAFGPEGIRLVDDAGVDRPDVDIQGDIERDLIAWDSGTERNQAGALGRDQAPRQSGPNTGADEGNGLVRSLMDPVWGYGQPADIVQVTLGPAS